MLNKKVPSDSTNSESGFLKNQEIFLSSDFRDITELHLSPNGYCNLYKAQRMGKWFVLKCLKPTYADNPEFQALLQKEYEIGHNLNHPYIVQTIGIEHVDKLGLSIILEYIEGHCLKDLIDKKELERADIVSIMKALASAVDYIHSCQIIHRDLKPSNIMISAVGNYVKIIDFGFSDANDYAILKQPAGSRRYMAPEQLNEDTVLDGRADIYALGIILREMNDSLAHPSSKFKTIAAKCCVENRDKRPTSLKNVQWDGQHRRLYVSVAVVLLFIFVLLLNGPFFKIKSAVNDSTSNSRSAMNRVPVVNGSQTKVNNVASKPIAGVSVVKDVSKNKLSTKPIQISRQTNSSLSSRETVTSVNQNEQKTSSPGVDAQSVTNGTTALGNQSETAKKEIDRGDETDKFESIIRKITRENQKEYFHRIETGQTHIVTNKVLDGNEINEDATENYNRLTNKIRQAARDFAKQNKESYSSLSSSALTIMHDELSKIILSDGYNEKMDAVYDKAKKLRAKSERQP